MSVMQENRREYEKRVASIVEQSWLIFGDEAEGKEATKGGGGGTSADWASPFLCNLHRSNRKFLNHTYLTQAKTL